jgi:hypothetical protein
LKWEFNDYTGAAFADVGPSTRLVRLERGGNVIYRAEYRGDRSLIFPVRIDASTPKKALKALCADVAKLRGKKR